MVRVCRICTSSGHAPQRKKKHNGPPFSPSLSLPTTSQPTHFLPKVRLRAPCRALPSCDVRRCLPMAWLAIPEGSAVCSMMLCLPSCSCTLLPRSCPHPPRHLQHSFAPAVLLVHPPATLMPSSAPPSTAQLRACRFARAPTCPAVHSMLSPLSIALTCTHGCTACLLHPPCYNSTHTPPLPVLCAPMLQAPPCALCCLGLLPPWRSSLH